MLFIILFQQGGGPSPNIVKIREIPLTPLLRPDVINKRGHRAGEMNGHIHGLTI